MENKLSLVIDCETTGVNPSLDRVCELAIVLTDWRSVYAVLTTFINPGFAFSNSVNGLSLRECGSAPSFRDLCNDGLALLLRSCDEFVGHNVAFDLRFLAVEFRHLGLSWPQRPVFDTMARMGRRSLSDACAAAKIDTRDITWHSALGDCVATFRLAQRLRADASLASSADEGGGIVPRFQ